MQLRENQSEALKTIFNSFSKNNSFTLVQAPCGYGKTIVASHLMKDAFYGFSAKCLFIAHLTELVLQTKDKFIQVNEVDKTGKESPEIGTYCDAADSKKECGDITIGSRQSVCSGIGKGFFADIKFNLIIIDEVHEMEEYGKNGQYSKIIDFFMAKNPRLRVLGVTGTPFKTKSGLIYGPKDKFFPELNFKVGMREMINKGYLCNYVHKVVDMGVDDSLEEIKINSKGDFQEGELSDVMSEEIHMESVMKVINEHAEGRKKIMVFAVNIAHAEKLAEKMGVECIHSNLNKDKWRRVVDNFKFGDTRIIINVTQLSIGFDCPEVDCIVMARPTLSPALYVQVSGRGLRLSDGKKDCLILDIVNNYTRHGSICDPKVRKGKKEKLTEEEKKEKAADICSECLNVVESGETICPYCGAEMEVRKEIIELKERLRMIEVDEAEKEAAKYNIVVKAWIKEGIVTRRGSHGIWGCVKLKNREKPLFRFAGTGTNKECTLRENISMLENGSKVKLIQTSYGEWIA